MKTHRTIKQAWPLAGIMIAMALLSSGCSQGVSPIAKNNKPLPLTAAWVSAGAGNSSNIYDSVGYYHNLALDYVAANNLTDPQPWITGAAAFTVAQGWTPTDSLASMIAFLSAYAANPTAVWDTAAPSSGFLNFMGKLDTVLDTASDVSNLVSGTKTIEGQILTSGMNPNEKPFLLCYSSVLRYSATYWGGSDALKWDSDTNDWVWSFKQRQNKITPSKIDPNKVKKIVVADATGSILGSAAGFVAGGIVGAFLGSFGGPIGTIAGSAGGAIVGSLEGAIAGGIVSSIQTATGP